MCHKATALSADVGNRVITDHQLKEEPMPTEPTEDQLRILQELAEAPDPSTGGLSDRQLAERLDMPVAEVRDHVQALVDLGCLDSLPQEVPGPAGPCRRCGKPADGLDQLCDPCRASNTSDYLKFAYHHGTRTMRIIQDRICEVAYTGTPFGPDERDALCATLSELDEMVVTVVVDDPDKCDEAAGIIRVVWDRICGITDTGITPGPDGREMLCDLLIELHQLWYSVTLFAIRKPSDSLFIDDEVGTAVKPISTAATIVAAYADDEVYSTGRRAITRILPPPDFAKTTIPASAYRGDVGEGVPPGGVIHVWRPDEADRSGLDDDEVDPLVDTGVFWKSCADLRAQGWIEWVRTSNGRIRKRPGLNGRLTAASIITAAGCVEAERVEGLVGEKP